MQSKYVLTFSIILVCLLQFMGCDSQQDLEVDQISDANGLSVIDQEKLHTALVEWAEKYELMGASVVLIAKGQPVFEDYLGYARIADSVKTTVNTSYRIASISKNLTTLAVLKLVESGQLNLSDDISRYLGWELRNPKFPDVPISLGHIMGHQSGIRDGSGYGRFISAMGSEAQQIHELFTQEGQYFTTDMFADHKAGEYFSYCNASWGIIASVVEKISGQRFDEFCKEQLFEPMGMQASFNILDIPLSDVAILYRASEGTWKPQADDVVSNLPTERAPANYELGSNGLVYGPQGSLRASTHDLKQLAKLYLNNGIVDSKRILKPETLAILSEGKWEFDGNNGDTWSKFWMSYGKGTQFIVNADSADIIFPDRKMMGHPGIAYGLLSDMYVDPNTQSGVIFITNGSKQAYEYGPTTSFYEVEEALFNLLYPILLAVEAK